MKRLPPVSQRGFTIVELLVVVVVIAILAAITIVAFNGIQARARDSQRLSDVQEIIKDLELYKTQNGAYPQTGATVTAVCATHNNGYSFSDATDGKWLSLLVSSGILSKVPVAPGNDCTSYYSYLWVAATSYNCPARTVNYYILQVFNVEGTLPTPSGTVPYGTTWRPCVGASAGWGTSASVWTFEKDDI